MSDKPPSAEPARDSVIPKRLKRLSRFLDDSIRLPGGFRVGWDGIIGLIPGIGDAAGLLMSVYIVAGAARLGVAKSVMARMCANIVIESVVGAIPVVGDLFDFVFKANSKNLRLIERHGYSSRRTGWHSIAWLLILGAFLFLAAAAPIYAITRMFIALFGLF